MIFWLNSFILIFLLIPFAALADGFVSLVGVPFLDVGPGTTTGSYVNALYRLSISIAALLAVVKLIYSGVLIALSGANITSREEAKKEIRGAIIGLLIILAAITILREVNPQLANFNIFTNVPTPVLNRTTTPIESKDESCIRKAADGTCEVTDIKAREIFEATGIAVTESTETDSITLTKEELIDLDGRNGAEASLAITQKLNAKQREIEATCSNKLGVNRNVNRKTGVVVFVCRDR